MPLMDSILDNQVLGREYKRGLQEGEQRGEQETELRVELKVLRRLMEWRFGAIPAWAEERLAARSAAELEELIVRVLDASPAAGGAKNATHGQHPGQSSPRSRI